MEKTNHCDHYPDIHAQVIIHGNEYGCKKCYYEKEKKNDFEKITEMKCDFCLKIGPFQKHCQHCEKQVGNYICLECNILSDQDHCFHCNDCQFCWIKKDDSFHHCEQCQICVFGEKHICTEENRDGMCALCQKPWKESDSFFIKSIVHGQLCGHFMHRSCYEESDHGYKIPICPLCDKSMDQFNHEQLNAFFEAFAKHFQLILYQKQNNLPITIPEEAEQSQVFPCEKLAEHDEYYDNLVVEIFCNDCRQCSENIKYRFINHACTHCRSCNTKVIHAPAELLEKMQHWFI